MWGSTVESFCLKAVEKHKVRALSYNYVEKYDLANMTQNAMLSKCGLTSSFIHIITIDIIRPCTLDVYSNFINLCAGGVMIHAHRLLVKIERFRY